MWPWRRIKYLEQQVQYWKDAAAHEEKWRLRYEKLFIERARDLFAAHKGIRRLVERVKRLKGHP